MYAEPDLRGLDAESRVSHRHRRSLEMAAMERSIEDSDKRLPTRRFSDDPVEGLRRIAVLAGAEGVWKPITDAPRNITLPVPFEQVWETSDNGHTIIHAAMSVGEKSYFAGFVFDRAHRLTDRIVVLPSDVDMKSLDEIEALKNDWLKDPEWDLEEAEGFAPHKEELHAFQLENERRWEQERKDRAEAELVKKMEELGTDNRLIAGYVLRLEATIKGLEERLAIVESR